MNEPTHVDLFSGIGGFALAARWAGFRTVGFVERDKFCQKILAQHWPGVPIFDDICQFDGKPFAGVDLLTGGFPCQPFSVAGKRRGKEDDRYLWPEMFRAIQESKPAWIIGENVAGLDGLGLDGCISDLESIGYEVAPPLEIPACAVGAPHIRVRIWIVAHAMPERKRGQSRKGETEAIACHTDSLRGLEQKRGVREFGGRHLHSNWWESQPEPSRVDDGLPNGPHRRDALGNAIVPQAAFQILKEIRKLI